MDDLNGETFDLAHRRAVGQPCGDGLDQVAAGEGGGPLRQPLLVDQLGDESVEVRRLR